MPFLLLIFEYIKNNKTIQAIISIIVILIIIVSVIGYEVHSIKSKQEIEDKLTQEQLYNSALMEQIDRDKDTINKFTLDMNNLHKQEDIKKDDLDKIIKQNNDWASEKLPSNINGDLND